MLNAKETDQLNSRFTQLWLIWGCIFSSLFIYVGFSFLIPQTQTIAQIQKLTYIGYGYAVMIWFTSRMIKQQMQQSKLPLKSDQEQISTEEILFAAIQKYQTTLIVTIAMMESIGIVGLVLFFLGGGRPTLIAFTVVAGVGIAFYRPRREEIIDMIQSYRY